MSKVNAKAKANAMAKNHLQNIRTNSSNRMVNPKDIGANKLDAHERELKRREQKLKRAEAENAGRALMSKAQKNRAGSTLSEKLRIAEERIMALEAELRSERRRKGSSSRPTTSSETTYDLISTVFSRDYACLISPNKDKIVRRLSRMLLLLVVW